jgi:hypothetical protein
MSIKVMINYKSGRQVEMEVESFKIDRDANGLKEFTWNMSAGSRVNPLFLNLNEVESVWEVW